MHLNDEFVDKIIHFKAQVLNLARPATDLGTTTLLSQESTNLVECASDPSDLILDSTSKKIVRRSSTGKTSSKNHGRATKACNGAANRKHHDSCSVPLLEAAEG